MTKIWQSLYYGSPIPIQNAAVSLLGARLYWQRYGPGASSCLASLERSQWLSEDGLRALQERSFVAIARHAIERVPHYRRWARDSDIEAADISSITDLQRFPILSKEEVRKAPRDFLAEGFESKSFTLDTSGTTGTPLTVFCDTQGRRHHYAFFTRLRQWFGLSRRARRATLFGRIIMRPEQSSPPYWRFDAAQNNLLMSSYHLSSGNLGQYLAKLRSFRPQEIIGYPSSLHALARAILESGRRTLNPKLVITTAETLLPVQREDLEAAFACPVINQYGCTEMAFFASQCEHGTMHMHPEHGVEEVVGPSGQQVAPGRPGRLIATGLVNFAMPLIRYEVGDVLSVEGGACDCGRRFPIVTELHGRTDDILITPDGRPLGRLDPVFKGASRIVRAQVVQPSIDRLIVNLETDPDFRKENAQDLIVELRKRTGPDMSIEIRQVEELQKEPGGKFRAVKRLFPLEGSLPDES